MTLFRTLIFLLAGLVCLAADPPDDDPNSKYSVESIRIAPSLRERLSEDLRKELDAAVGKPYDPKLTERITQELKRKLPMRRVSSKLEKGAQKDTVRVVIEALRRYDLPISSEQVAFGYHSSLGWNADLIADFDIGPLDIGFGFKNDGQQQIERQAGIQGFVQHRHVGTDRLRLRFDWASQRAQWNPATLRALDLRRDLPGIYRERQRLVPSASVALTESITLTGGFAFNRVEFQFPAVVRNANTVFGKLNFDRRWDNGTTRQRVRASYRIDTAQEGLSSDFRYTRQQADLRYTARFRREEVTVAVQGGVLNGQAPLFERFNLGNLTTLRGWNQFDVAPLGGSRYFHSTFEYRTRAVFGYYDTGSVWDRNGKYDAKHAVGFGIGGRDLQVGVGFPLRSGSIQPVFFVRFGK